VFAFKEKEQLPYLVEKENKPKLDPEGRKTQTPNQKQ
jgi:hypothetical protein